MGYAQQMQQWEDDLDNLDGWEAQQMLQKVQSRINSAEYQSGARSESETEQVEVQKRLKKKGSIF